MHWHPPQNSTESKQGADLPTYTVVPNGLNPSKISSLTHAISQIFPNKFQSSHIISVFGRCIRSIFCQNLSNSCRNKYIIGQFRNLIFVWVFLSIGPNYAYLPSVVKNSNIRRPVLRMLLACTSYDLRWVHQNVHSGPKECVKYDTRKTRLAINFLIWKRRLLGATNPSSSTPL